MRPGLTCAAERAADEGRDDPDTMDGHPVRLRVCLLGRNDRLHLVPHGQLITVPACDGRGQLHRIVVVACDAVPAVSHDLGPTQGGLWITTRVVELVVAGTRDRLRRIDVGQLGDMCVGDPNHGSAVRSGAGLRADTRLPFAVGFAPAIFMGWQAEHFNF